MKRRRRYGSKNGSATFGRPYEPRRDKSEFQRYLEQGNLLLGRYNRNPTAENKAAMIEFGNRFNEARKIEDFHEPKRRPPPRNRKEKNGKFRSRSLN